MLRIHFTGADLARVRVAPTIGPLTEAFHSLQILAHCAGSLPFRPWRDRLPGPLDEDCRPLWSLLPSRTTMLDLTGLAGMDPSAEAGLDQLLGVDDRTMRLELAHVGTPGADRAWLTGLMDGDLAARRVLVDSLDACHRALIAPHWSRMRAHLDAYRADCARTVLDGGVERLLETLCPPSARWRPPVLEIAHFRSKDIHLDGRGLVIAPMVFMTGRPELLFDLRDEAAPLVLAVPTVRDPLAAAALWGDAQGGAEALAALLGRTRAAALEFVTESCSTSELARRLNVSPAAASQHATVLRNANLITTRRRGGAVLHTITPLGADLLSRAGAAG